MIVRARQRVIEISHLIRIKQIMAFHAKQNFPVHDSVLQPHRVQASRRYLIILMAAKLISIIIFIRVTTLVIRPGILPFTTKGIILPGNPSIQLKKENGI